jgi:hypothetical protein
LGQTLIVLNLLRHLTTEGLLHCGISIRCRTMTSADVMAITKWSISGSEKNAAACAAIASSYRHYVAAYLAGRVHRAVPSNKN